MYVKALGHNTDQDVTIITKYWSRVCTSVNHHMPLVQFFIDFHLSCFKDRNRRFDTVGHIKQA